MSGTGVAQSGLIDCTRRLSFSYDGKAYAGLDGDTVASALLANGVRVMGRSVNYHRVWRMRRLV